MLIGFGNQFLGIDFFERLEAIKLISVKYRNKISEIDFSDLNVVRCLLRDFSKSNLKIDFPHLVELIKSIAIFWFNQIHSIRPLWSISDLILTFSRSAPIFTKFEASDGKQIVQI